jgi:F0F1-type ATP synthase assembly protein I
MRQPRPRNKALVSAGEYISLAFMLPAAVFVGYLIGTLLDRYFETNFLYIVFLLLGIAAGLIEVVRKFLKDARQAERETVSREDKPDDGV